MLTLAPVTINSTTPVDVPLPTTAAAIIIDNLTGYTLQAQMSGTGSAIWVQASQGNILKAPSTLGFSGVLVLIPFALQTNLSQAPGTQVTITIYGAGEQIPGGYPIPLGGGLVNVGNNLNLGTSTSSIVNDGNTQQNIIESTPSGAGGSTVLVDNDGNFTVKGNNAGTLTTLLQLIAGASPAVKLAAAAVLTEALGNLQVDGNLTVTGSSSLDNGAIVSDGTGVITIANNKALQWKDTLGSAHNILSLDSSNNPVIRTTSNNGQLNVEDGSGNTVAIFSTSQGAQVATQEGSLNVQKVFFNTGSLKDIATGTVTVNATSTATVNHGLSGTPAAVLGTCDTSGSTGTFSIYNYTSTQFTILNGAGVQLTFRWFAYR